MSEEENRKIFKIIEGVIERDFEEDEEKDHIRTWVNQVDAEEQIDILKQAFSHIKNWKVLDRQEFIQYLIHKFSDKFDLVSAGFNRDHPCLPFHFVHKINLCFGRQVTFPENFPFFEELYLEAEKAIQNTENLSPKKMENVAKETWEKMADIRQEIIQKYPGRIDEDMGAS